MCVLVTELITQFMSGSVTPWTVARQAPLSTGLSRQEYWSGLPFPPPGDLPNSEIEPQSPILQANSLLSEPPGNLLLAKLLFIKQFKTRAVEFGRKSFLPTRGHLAISKTFFIMTTERDATGIYCIG